MRLTRLLLTGILGLAAWLPSALAIEAPRGLYDPRTGLSRTTGDPYPVFPEGLERPIPVNRMRTNSTDSVLVILIQTPDEPHQYGAATFDSLLLSVSTYPTGSLRDYFHEVSYGKFDLSGMVMGWYTAENAYYTYTHDEYGLGDQPNAQTLAAEAVLAADAAGVDFSHFDNDGDGYVDGLIIVHQGPGGEFTGDANDIWSHMWALPAPYETDGVTVFWYSMDPEIGGDGSSGEIEPIAVFAHEYSHMLGCPDLYDYDSKLDTTTYNTPGDHNDHPVQDWCIMGYGGYGLSSFGKGVTPTHLCGYLKYFLGWITPIVLDSSQMQVVVNEIETTDSNSLYKVPINGSATEYFLVENRNPRSSAKFDHLDSDYSAWFRWFTPGPDTLDGGLLITHVDEGMWGQRGRFNDGTPMNPHYGILVMDAGYNPSRVYDDTSEFTEWWYPWEFQIGACFAAEDSGQSDFTPYTTPSSNGYGGPSNIRITNISPSGSQMTFDFALGLPGIGDGEGGGTLSPQPRLALRSYPNPFREGAEITYNVPAQRGTSAGQSIAVSLKLYNLSGQLVRVLVDQTQPAGRHVVVWNGRDGQGQPAPSGVYLSRLIVRAGSADEIQDTRRIVHVP